MDRPSNHDRLVEKFLLALRCLNAATALDPKNPALHAQAVEFRHALNSEADSLPAKVKEVLEANFTAIPASADLRKVNADFQAQHQDSAQHRIAAARAAKLLGEDATKVEKDLFDVLRSGSTTFTDAASILELLRNWRSSEADAFKNAARGKWPEVTLFA